MTTEATRTDPALSLRGLRRTYGSGPQAFEAVRGIDLDVQPGTITALLGTNGAGKTSTLELVEGLAEPSGGEVRVFGLDPVADRAEVRRRTGVLLQTSGFPGDLTVAETLRMWAATLTRARTVEESLALLGMQSRADTPVRGLSGGELRRLDLTCALMGDPELVLLDEPTTGLDPESRREVWRLVRDLSERGATVVFSTHHLEEAETLADRLAIMHAGVIAREGTPEEIVGDHPATIRFAPVTRTLPDLPRAQVGHEDGHTVLTTGDLQGTLTILLTWAASEDIRLEGLSARSASLESVFLSIADSDAPPTAPSAPTAPTAPTADRALEGSLR